MSAKSLGFGGSVVFAALVALGFVPGVGLARGFMDTTTAAALYVTASAAAYGVLLGATRPARVGAAALTLALGLPAVVWFDRLAPTVFVLTLAVALSRGRITCAGRLSQQWLVEVVLGVLSLVGARAAAGPGLTGAALGVWAYWLIQSAYFLVPARAARSGLAEPDPFDAAMRRATDLMDNS